MCTYDKHSRGAHRIYCACHIPRGYVGGTIFFLFASCVCGLARLLAGKYHVCHTKQRLTQDCEISEATRRMTWHGMVWYDMICYDICWCDWGWYDMTWQNTIWYDVVWFDMMRKGMIWFDMICKCLHACLLTCINPCIRPSTAAMASMYLGTHTHMHVDMHVCVF